MPERPEREVKSISSVNTDWYQWGLNCQILEYGMAITNQIIETAISGYGATEDDVNLFWEGYYSVPKSGFKIFSSRNGAVSKNRKRKMFAYGCNGINHAVWTATEWLNKDGNIIFAEDHGCKIICKCTHKCEGNFLTDNGESKGGFLI